MGEEALLIEEIRDPQEERGIGFIEGLLVAIFSWPITTVESVNDLATLLKERKKNTIITAYYLLIVLMPLLITPPFLIWLFGMELTALNFVRMFFFELFLSILYFALVWISSVLYSAFSSIITSSFFAAPTNENYSGMKRGFGFLTFVIMLITFVISFFAIDFLIGTTLDIPTPAIPLIVFDLLISSAVMAAVVIQHPI